MSYRVIQYATGLTARLVMRTIAQRPDLTLVGLGVLNPDKVGRDAGELAKTPETGVKATADLEALYALDADVVMHMPLPSALMSADPSIDEDVICNFLASGKNVITTVGYVYPKAYGPDVVERLEAACERGATSLHGTGFNPGFVSDVLPATLLSMSATVERVYVQDSTDFATHPNASFVKGYLGFGLSPEEFEGRTVYRAYTDALFKESLMLLADCLGESVEEMISTVDYHVATEDVEVASGVIPRGAVSAACNRWRAVIGGREMIHLCLIYRARADQGTHWGGGKEFVFEIDGRPKMKLEFEHDWLSNGLLGTAAHAVNAIPHVVDAAPGIRSFIDLPMIRAIGAAGKG